MTDSLGKQFSDHLTSGNFDAANQVIKQARSLNYPKTLINFWNYSLAKLEPGFRHPLESAQESKIDNLRLGFQLGHNL